MPPPAGKRASNPSPKSDRRSEIRRGVKRRLLASPSSGNATGEDDGEQQKPDEGGKNGESRRHLPEDAGPSLPRARKSTSRRNEKSVTRCRSRRTPLRDITSFVNAMDRRTNPRSHADRRREAGPDPSTHGISADGPVQREPSAPKETPLKPPPPCDAPPVVKRLDSTGDDGKDDAPEETSRKPKRCKTLKFMR